MIETSGIALLSPKFAAISPLKVLMLSGASIFVHAIACVNNCKLGSFPVVSLVGKPWESLPGALYRGYF